MKFLSYVSRHRLKPWYRKSLCSLRGSGWAAVLMTGLPLYAQQEHACPAPPSHIEMGSGTFTSQPGVTFVLHHFAATMVPRGKTAPMCYEKTTLVSRAEIFVSNESLTKVFAAKLGDSNSKIKDFGVQNGLGKVTLTGNISKFIPVHFSISGPVTTDGTLISIDAQAIKADGVPVKALLAMIGEQLGTLLGLKGMNGIVVDGNRLSFSPERIAHLKGFITAAEATPKGLTLHYGTRPGLVRPSGNVKGGAQATSLR